MFPRVSSSFAPYALIRRPGVTGARVATKVRKDLDIVIWTWEAVVRDEGIVVRGDRVSRCRDVYAAPPDLLRILVHLFDLIEAVCHIQSRNRYAMDHDGEQGEEVHNWQTDMAHKYWTLIPDDSSGGGCDVPGVSAASRSLSDEPRPSWLRNKIRVCSR